MGDVKVWSPITKAEADIMVASLASEGIQAYVMGALDRSYAPMGQVHVFVDEADRDRALEIIESHPNELPIDPDDLQVVSPHRRRRAGLVLLAAYIVVPLLILVGFILALTGH